MAMSRTFGDVFNPPQGADLGRPFPVPRTTDPQDWQCANKGCKNINFKKRLRCNMCGSEKPPAVPLMDTTMMEQDVRGGGRAGGFFDRQHPADRVEHNSSDEEFDDFGRRKKKKKQVKRADDPKKAALERLYAKSRPRSRSPR
mmetsp:Transcript_26391/g.59761  ORF Transcript_26391/g.59761 Transcript_26391/m.59761 type:complete len:143 (+) Transcript_26391:67-495(+)|eukprot:CAMPEP_0204326310 /NCGR_PEP_ID=MMETSP0469-20131031/11724_1 /ASSEMBLY_ACC=CAM_ASM_000384 /TAXON_ID=2969 /ORGANISM="Oxyrrhis marina" /LENGTH=142 /DNA_ID=CAMNT_0051308337 /DNA_START=18 /DNA_END=446 /DNA_ORIENTATION=-